jgi:hypothetical protein
MIDKIEVVKSKNVIAVVQEDGSLREYGWVIIVMIGSLTYIREYHHKFVAKHDMLLVKAGIMNPVKDKNFKLKGGE